MSSLRDGDEADCAQAEEVVQELASQGYVYSSYNFLHTDTILVISHMHPMGNDTTTLSHAEKVLAVYTLGPLAQDQLELIEKNHWGALNQPLLDSLATSIREARHAKGLL